VGAKGNVLSRPYGQAIFYFFTYTDNIEMVSSLKLYIIFVGIGGGGGSHFHSFSSERKVVTSGTRA